MNLFKLSANKKPFPCGIVGFATNFESDNCRTTKKSDFKNGVNVYHISTVFLGVNHNYRGNGKPILWETMVFSEGSYYHTNLLRATSHKQAVRFHNRVVNAVRNNHASTVLRW
jgi:hypothetical protein